MPRLFFMADSVNIWSSALCASGITAYRQEFGRVREKACCCCCCCCLASNSLHKCRLIEQQSAFTQQRLYLWERKIAVPLCAAYLTNAESNWGFSGQKRHPVCSCSHPLLTDLRSDRYKDMVKTISVLMTFCTSSNLQQIWLDKTQPSFCDYEESGAAGWRHCSHWVLGDCFIFSPEVGCGPEFSLTETLNSEKKPTRQLHEVKKF